MKRKKSKSTPAEIVTVRIPRATLREIDAIARKQKVTRTALILFALRVSVNAPKL